MMSLMSFDLSGGRSCLRRRHQAEFNANCMAQRAALTTLCRVVVPSPQILSAALSTATLTKLQATRSGWMQRFATCMRKHRVVSVPLHHDCSVRSHVLQNNCKTAPQAAGSSGHFYGDADPVRHLHE